MADTLGIKFLTPEKEAEIPPNVKELADEREKYRGSKQFVKADELRKEIDALGFIVEDTVKVESVVKIEESPEGPIIKPKK